MAKGKHATALFEVIHSARKPPINSPAAQMPAPRSWWKGRSRQIDSIEDLRGVGSAPQGGVFSAPLPIEAPPAPRIVAEPTYIDHIEAEPIGPMDEPPVRSTERSVQVKTGGGEVSFRLSYGGAAAIGFILVLLIAIAFLVGTRSADLTSGDDEAVATNTGGNPATGETGMLAAVTPTHAIGTVAAAVNPNPSTVATAPAASAPPIAPSAAAAAAASQRVVRQVGLNYVIIQSFPSQETAQRAAEFLIDNGIPCTVKQGLPGWTLRNWYSVIGVRAFSRVQNNPELEAYKNRLQRLGDVFAGRNTFNRFEPTAYRWRAEADDDSAQ